MLHSIFGLLTGCLLLLSFSQVASAQQLTNQNELENVSRPTTPKPPDSTGQIFTRPESGQEAGVKNDWRRQSDSITKPTLTPSEKLEYGLRKAFLSPEAYFQPGIGAYSRERKTANVPGKSNGDQLADGLSSYARAFGRRSTAQLFGSGIYPIIFKQDPRYKPSNRSGVVARLLYAASRTVVTQGDNGKSQINYSKLAGNMTSASLANLYERNTVTSRDAQGRILEIDRQVGVGPTFRRFGMFMLTGSLSRIAFDEFDLDGKAGKALRGLFNRD